MVEVQPGPEQINLQSVPTSDKDTAIQTARTALLIAGVGVLMLLGTYVMDAQFFRLDLDLSLRYPLSYLGFSLAGLLSLVAIVYGSRNLRNSRRSMLAPSRAKIFARSAIALGIITILLASFSALAAFILSNFSFKDV